MHIVDKILSFIAPNVCLNCSRDGWAICAWCKEDVCLPTPDRCYRCRRVSSGSLVCEKCKKMSKLKHVWTVTDFEGIAKRLVYKLKFGRSMSCAKSIAEYIDDSLPHLFGETIVTHVPTANTRIRQRGYDQSGLIAKHLAKQRKLTYRSLLVRHGSTRQVGTKRSERIAQLKGAFEITKPSMVNKAHILIVDDVLTTGATIEEVAKVLKKAGARSVDAVVFAQANQ